MYHYFIQQILFTAARHNSLFIYNFIIYLLIFKNTTCVKITELKNINMHTRNATILRRQPNYQIKIEERKQPNMVNTLSS